MKEMRERVFIYGYRKRVSGVYYNMQGEWPQVIGKDILLN